MADDPKPNPHAERIAALAASHADDVVKTLVSVMKDPRSRQRVAAAMHLADLMCLTGPAALERPSAGRGNQPPMTRDEALKYWREQQAQQAKKASSSNDT